MAASTAARQRFRVRATPSRCTDTRRPDLVLFVNGIPLGVIECKSAAKGVEEGVSQTLRNQREGEIPSLFVFAQIVMSVAQNAAKYATLEIPRKFWSVWKEAEAPDVIQSKIIVNWTRNLDLQKSIENDLNDGWFDLAEAEGFNLPLEEVDALLEQILEIAKRRYKR